MPATIASRIVELLAEPAARVRAADVRIGLGYTAVALADGRAGVAYTFRDEAKGGCSVFHGRRPLADSSAAELLALLTSADRIEAGVGLACANALTQGGDAAWQPGDVIAGLDLRADDDVAMVGRFGPLIEPLRTSCRSLTILERADKAHGDERPTEEAAEVLPRCQVALLTATSIINHTFDELLRAATDCREVAVVGASTPLTGEVFSRTPVTLLSGVVVEQPTEVLRVVSEGGGMRQFKPHIRKVCLQVNPPADSPRTAPADQEAT